jgi:aspartate kinase
MEGSRQVLKIGGTSVGSGECIRRVAGIIRHHVHGGEEMFPVVVVSAMSGVTDQLLRIARFACIGDHESWQQELEALKRKHAEAADKAVHRSEVRRALQHDLQIAFSMLEQDISAVQAGISRPTKEQAGDGHATALALYAASTISAWGERFSVLLVAAAARDLGVQSVPVREEVIVTTDLQADTLPACGTVIGADPLPQETRVNAERLIHPLIERGIVPVVPGFIGRTTGGCVTTLGRNGSDYCATLLGAALDCAEVTVYTDVDGVLSADRASLPIHD